LTFSAVLREKMNPEAKFRKELHLRTNDLIIDDNTKGQPDGNNVDYERQATMLVRNALHQEVIITQIESELRMMRSSMRK
jgi:flagellar basal body rod protein FlgB